MVLFTKFFQKFTPERELTLSEKMKEEGSDQMAQLTEELIRELDTLGGGTPRGYIRSVQLMHGRRGNDDELESGVRRDLDENRVVFERKFELRQEQFENWLLKIHGLEEAAIQSKDAAGRSACNLIVNKAGLVWLTFCLTNQKIKSGAQSLVGRDGTLTPNYKALIQSTHDDVGLGTSGGRETLHFDSERILPA